jgi:hypothetical protein
MTQTYLDAELDRLRLELQCLTLEEQNIKQNKAVVLQEILMTRRQIAFPERYIVQSTPRALAPIDYLDI